MSSGLSAQTKAFFDRTFCYYAASHPRSAEVIEGMSRKRLGRAIFERCCTDYRLDDVRSGRVWAVDPDG